MAGQAVVPGANRAQAKPKEQQISENAQNDLQERIRGRANDIYLERGGQGGSELDDWLQAEREILGREQPEE
jgi:hypothetical protein